MKNTKLPDHNITGAVFQDRRYIRAELQPGEERIVVLVVDQSFVVKGDRRFKWKQPYPVPGVHEHIQDLVIRKSVAGGEVAEMGAIEAAEPRLGAEPHESVLVLRHAVYGRSCQPIVEIVMHV